MYKQIIHTHTPPHSTPEAQRKPQLLVDDKTREGERGPGGGGGEL